MIMGALFSVYVSVFGMYLMCVFVTFCNNNNFYLTTGVTVIDKPLWLLDTCHWFGAECILLLNTDLGSVYDANASMLRSISTGTDEDKMKKMTRLLLRMMMKIFALTWTGEL